ncbi:MAG: hypothetical protein DRJ66_00780 [Thermoprotei archaeon]|nr:MAG: hypothetical protein DRJ66_00780 [Thermoprotei archaeon]RLF18797.1 MAG: hypothetical protein DRZ82_07555 [Thermoprotei archaeon]
MRAFYNLNEILDISSKQGGIIVIRRIAISTKYRKETLIVLTIIGFGILILYLKLLSPENVFGLLRKTNILLVLASTIVNVLYLSLYGIVWWYVLRNIRIRVSLGECILGGYISLLGDMVIPSASLSGEMLRIAYGMYRLGINGSVVFTSIAIHRLLNSLSFGLVVILGFLGIILTTGTAGYNSLIKYLALAVIAILLTLLGLFLILNSGRIADYLHRRGKARRLVKFLRDVNKCTTMFRRNIIGTILTFLLAIARWMVGALIVFLLFLAIGYDPGYWKVLFAYPLYGISLLIPIGIPAMIGIMDTTMITIFMILGINKSVAVAVALLSRLVMTGFTILYIILVGSFFGLADLLSEVSKRNKH